MSEARFDPTIPARQLTAACRAGEALTELAEAERPTTLAQGYATQAAFVAQLGEGTVGWKLAGASPRGLRGDLPNPPAIGTLTPSRVFKSNAVVTLPPGRQATLEVEAAFTFARAVAPADEAFDAASMIDCATVAVEVVCSRFVDRKEVGQPSFIADNVGFHALIRGDMINHAADPLFEADAGIWRDGERIAESLAGDDRTKPFLSLGHLWERLAAEGARIPAGAVVTTGTLSVPVDVAAGGDFVARVGGASLAFSLV
ncbi:hydratase [Cupriavidus pauculus]|nr:hydratase [Cupriavidus pauculus]